MYYIIFLLKKLYFDIMCLMKRIDELLENMARLESARLEEKIERREKKKKPKMKVSGKGVFQIKKLINNK